MLIKGIGHYKTIPDHLWKHYKALGYIQVDAPNIAVKPQESPKIERTKEDVFKELDEKGIEYDKRAKKADLIKLLEV